MKVMISQPMHGKTEKEIRYERESLVNYLEEGGYEVIDTVISNESPNDDNVAIHYLSKSIDFIADVDGIVFMKGWEKSRGCRVEHLIATEYGKEMIYCNF